MSAPPSAPLHLATAALSAAVVLVPLLYAPALQAPFLVAKFAALELTAALALTAFALRRCAPSTARWSPAVALGAGLVLATSTLSWLWALRAPTGAPYALGALARWAALFGLAAGASLLDERPEARQRVLEATVVGAAAVSAVGLWQHFELSPLPIPVLSTPGSTFGNRNPAAEFVAMALPLALATMAGAERPGQRRAVQLAALLALGYLAATRTRGAWLGALAGLATTLLLMRWRPSRRALAGVAIATLLTVSLAVVPGRFNPVHAGDQKRFGSLTALFRDGANPRSTALRTRFGLWRRTVSMAREHAVLGVGPGNWPVFFPRYAEPGAARDGVLSAELAPRQAHNDLLERAAETGLLGLAALLFLAAGVARTVRFRLRSEQGPERASTAGAAGSLAALLALGLTGFPLEMPATLALAGLALGLVATVQRVADPAPRALSSWRVGVALGLALLAFAGVRAERRVRASWWLSRAERTQRSAHSDEGALASLGALERARALTPGEFRVHWRRAQVLTRLRRWAEAEQAARSAVALEPYAPAGHTVLAVAALGADDLAQARAEANRALALLSDEPLALLLRAAAAERSGDVAGAARDRERLRALAASDENSRVARGLASSLR